MAATKFPKWFSPHRQPGKPTPPPETIHQQKTVAAFDLYGSCSHELPDLAGATAVEARVRDQYDDVYVALTFFYRVEVPNPNYDRLLAQYEKDKIEYVARLAEWKSYMKQYDARQDERKAKTAERELKSKRALFNKLKRELGETDG